jgi:hypothetical protein
MEDWTWLWVVVGMVLFDVLAYRFGHDSRDGAAGEVPLRARPWWTR